MGQILLDLVDSRRCLILSHLAGCDGAGHLATDFDLFTQTATVKEHCDSLLLLSVPSVSIVTALRMSSLSVRARSAIIVGAT